MREFQIGREGRVTVSFGVFLKNFEDDADAGETQGWRASLEGFW